MIDKIIVRLSKLIQYKIGFYFFRLEIFFLNIAFLNQNLKLYAKIKNSKSCLKAL